MDRGAILGALAAVRGAAKAYFEASRSVPMDGPPVPLEPNIWDIGAPIVALLELQPEFDPALTLIADFGSVGVPRAPQHFIIRLLEKTSDDGEAKAFEWLEKLLSAGAAQVRSVRLIHGLKILEPVSLAGGRISLLPFDQVPASYNKEAEAAKLRFGMVHPGPFEFPAETAFVTEFEIPQFWLQNFDDSAIRPVQAELEALVHLIAVQIGAPVLSGRSWSDYVDPDLAAGRNSFGFGMAMDDVQPFMIAQENVDSVALVNIVEAYLALAPANREHIDVAVKRVAYGLRRREKADKILDAAIGLEALLGDRSDRGEITDRLARRAAVLIGGNLEARQATRASMKQFYGLRSSVVHSGRMGSLRGARAAAADAGFAIALRCVLEVISLGGNPPWDEWELMGRPAR